MEIERWWARLEPKTQKWLTDNNGDALPSAIVDEIVEAGGSVPDEWDDDEQPTSGPRLSDADVDWIESEANEE
jgi:hypothetical protein